MKPQEHKYRKLINAKGLVRSAVIERDSDLLIFAEKGSDRSCARRPEKAETVHRGFTAKNPKFEHHGEALLGLPFLALDRPSYELGSEKSERGTDDLVCRRHRREGRQGNAKVLKRSDRGERRGHVHKDEPDAQDRRLRRKVTFLGKDSDRDSSS